MSFVLVSPVSSPEFLRLFARVGLKEKLWDNGTSLNFLIGCLQNSNKSKI